MSQAGAASVVADTSSAVANRHKVMMLMATVARMGVGLVGFIVMARFLGPENFGVIATAAAYGSFIGIVTDFGLGVSALRTAAAAPDRAAEIVSDAFATKLILSIASTIIALGAAAILLPPGRIGVYALVFAGLCAYAFADLAMVAARAHRRFDIEAKVVVATSVVILLVVAGTAALTRSLDATAIAFMVTRFGYLAATQIELRRSLGIAIRWRRPFDRIVGTLRSSSSYAVDSILTSLSSQIDVLVFAVLLSAHDIGVYQAGSRLVQVIMPFAMVLSTVYMPALSSAAINRQADAFRRNSRRVNIEFCALAMVAGLGFTLFGPLGTHLVYGDKYEALVPLWAGFGAFAVLRLVAASYGIQLAAMGFIRTRIVAQLASIVCFVGMVAFAMPKYGLPVTSWLLGLSSLPVVLVSGIALGRDRNADRSVFATMAVAVAACILLALL